MRVYLFLIRYFFPILSYFICHLYLPFFEAWSKTMKSTEVLVVGNICKKLFFYSVPVVHFSCLFSLQVWVFNRISVYLLCCFFWHFVFPFLASVQTPNPWLFNIFSPHNCIYKGAGAVHVKWYFTRAVLMDVGEEEEIKL